MKFTPFEKLSEKEINEAIQSYSQPQPIRDYLHNWLGAVMASSDPKVEQNTQGVVSAPKTVTGATIHLIKCIAYGYGNRLQRGGSLRQQKRRKQQARMPVYKTVQKFNNCYPADIPDMVPLDNGTVEITTTFMYETSEATT